MSDIPAALFPSIRLRRTRRSASLRALVAETALSPADLIYPVFVLDGEGRTENVESMPGIERKSIDGILKDAALAASLGIPAIALFRSSMRSTNRRTATNAPIRTVSCSEPSGR